MLSSEDDFDAAMGRIEEVQRSAEEMRSRLATAVYKATARNKMLTVTVDGKGELQGLSFRGDAYRQLPPAELGNLIVETVARARQSSLSKAMASVREMSPHAASPLEFMASSTSMQAFMDNVLEMAHQHLPSNEPAATEEG